MENESNRYGYFHITISPSDSRKLLHSNDERAFIVTQLQDLLSPRLTLNNEPMHHQLSSCVDLLAFSITEQSIQCIMFSIDITISVTFGHLIADRLAEYQSGSKSAAFSHTSTSVSIRRFLTEREALASTVMIHSQHRDWEYDRYSSIGFYLHDRRGDWMRIWRMSRLYENSPRLYRKLLAIYRQQGTQPLPISSARPLVA